MDLHFFQSPLIAVLALGAAAGVSAHIILNKRDPRAALWWVWIVWWIPFLGSALYYFFGINRIQRRAYRLRQRYPLPEPAVAFVSPSEGQNLFSPRMRHLASLARMGEKTTGFPLLPGNAVTPLFNGDQAYPEMIRAIDGAERSVGLSTYIFDNDRAGGLFVEALARAVKRKVKVRVLLDGVGSRFSWKPVYAELEKHRIPAAYFMPTLLPMRMPYMNLRSHRKILTVDGRTAFTGGMNIREDHLLQIAPEQPTEDLHFKIEGPVAAEIQSVFREDWHFSTRQLLNGPDWFPELEPAGPVMARGIPNGPDENLEKGRWTLLGALANAKDSVRILTPYFLPDPALITALNLAALSGVRVDIVLPERTDLPLTRLASFGLLPQLLERGCRIWISPPPFHHGKLMLVDGGWTLLGSSNWDARSLRLNFEYDLECYDEALAGSLERYVDERISNAQELTLADFRKRRLPARLRDGAARLLAPFL
jgi:cardiolipin synthase